MFWIVFWTNFMRLIVLINIFTSTLLNFVLFTLIYGPFAQGARWIIMWIIMVGVCPQVLEPISVKS